MIVGFEGLYGKSMVIKTGTFWAKQVSSLEVITFNLIYSLETKYETSAEKKEKKKKK